jgi:hypothetical protein
MRVTRLSLIGLRLSELAGEVWFRISLGFAAVMLLVVAIFVYGPPVRVFRTQPYGPGWICRPWKSALLCSKDVSKEPKQPKRHR